MIKPDFNGKLKQMLKLDQQSNGSCAYISQTQNQKLSSTLMNLESYLVRICKFTKALKKKKKFGIMF